MLINRDDINPLTKLIPNADTHKMYHQIIDDNEEELLQYATLYDSFRLLVAYQERASSVKDITILCKNQPEADFISRFNNKFSTMICKKSDTDMTDFNILFIKNFNDLIKYRNLFGKSIYIAAANYNFDKETRLLNPAMVVLYSESNEIKLMDLYLEPKFQFKGEIDYGDTL